MLYFESTLSEAFVFDCNSGGNLTQPCSLLSVSGGSFPHGPEHLSTAMAVSSYTRKKIPQMMCFRDLPLKIKIKHRLFHLARFQFEKLGWISTD